MATSILDRNGNLLTDPMLDIPRGAYSQVTSVNKFGSNPNVASGVQEEIWDGSIAYVFETTAAITHIRSAVDSATTQGAVIEVQGLDGDWNLVIQTKALDGTNSTTEVALDTPLIRCFRMKVLDGSVMDQDIWAGDDDFLVAAARAIITAGNNQTLMAIYTVPAGKTAFVTGYYALVIPGAGNPSALPIKLWGRDNAAGYAAQLKHQLGIDLDFTSYVPHKFAPYYKFTEKTDIYITGQPVGTAAAVTAGFDLILVDNDRNW